MAKKKDAFDQLLADAGAATVKREGTDADGQPYSITIAVAGLSINGLELPSRMAADFIADQVEGAIKQKRAKRKGGGRARTGGTQ